MRTALLFLITLTTLCAAQSSADIPSCATSCLASAITVAGCTSGDRSCECIRSTTIANAATPCVLAACSTDDALKTQQVGEAICAALSQATGTTGPTQATSVPNATGSTNGSARKSRLSTGAKAGIGVGVTLTVLSVLANVWFLMRRRHKGRKNAGWQIGVATGVIEPAAQTGSALTNKAEKSSGVVAPYEPVTGVPELQDRAEGAPQQRWEVHGESTRPYELSGVST